MLCGLNLVVFILTTLSHLITMDASALVLTIGERKTKGNDYLLSYQESKI
jgi:hypothetical protein